MKLNIFFNIMHNDVKNHDDYVILRQEIKNRNIEILKIVTHKDEFLVPIMYRKFLKINSGCYIMYRNH
jgi:hypothetical protein